MSRRKPRLLCLMQLPPPIHGVSIVNERIARSRLLAERFTLDVHPLRFSESHADIRRVSPTKIWLAFVAAARLACSLTVSRPDAVYFTLTPTGGAFFRDCAFIAIIKSFGVRRVYHLHGKGIATQLSSRWKRSLYAWAFRDAHIIHLSPSLGADVAGVVRPERLVFIPNGVPDIARQSERAPDGTRIKILFLSAMARDKGPLVLLTALGELKRQGILFEATFAGPDPNDGCISEFEAQVDRLELREHVRYVGAVYGQAKAELFASHHVFAFPTWNDAFPLVVLEAMQSRLPVVATAEGAIPDMIVEAETGFLVAKGDAPALAERLAQLVRDPRMRRALGASARERYEQLYTFGHFERALADALDVYLMRSET